MSRRIRAHRRRSTTVRRTLAVSALSIVTALVTTGLTPVMVSSAAWNDSEWDHADVSTLSCTDEGVMQTRGAGRMLGGGLLPLDLDTAATVGGVDVVHDGAEAHPDPETAREVSGAYLNPLDVEALGLVNLPLTGGALDQLLSLPLANETGAVNQYARADSAGTAQGASGVVNDSGFIETDDGSGGELPALGTVSLATLVEQLTGDAASELVAGIADLQLELGAVASRATLDACGAAWTGEIDPYVERTYAVAGLDAVVDAPVASGLSTTLTGLLDGLETSLNGISGADGVVSSITDGVGQLLSGVLGTLNLGSTTVTGPSIDVDLTVARDLVGAMIADDAGAVSLDLGTGEVRVDLASLIGEAYGGEGFNGQQAHGLNGLDPNTELVLNDTVTNALVAALTQALDNWVADVVSAIEAAVMIAHVHTEIALVLGGIVGGNLLEVASVRVTVDGSLGSLLAGTATVNTGLSLLGGECNPLFPLSVACLIGILVNPLVNGITSALTNGVGPLVGGILESTILGENGLVPTLGSTLSTATAPVISALATILGEYLGADGLVSLRANVQNDAQVRPGPDPDPVLTYPDWESGTLAVPDGQYDVAALSIGVLSALGPNGNINLELARASVGPSCVIGAPACPG